MTKNERLELNQLSKEVYSTSSKWQKMINKGEIAPQVEKMDDGTERTYMGISYYSVEEIKKTMLELKAEQEADEEKELKLQQEEEARKQAAKIKTLAGETLEELVLQNQKDFEEPKEEVLKTILDTIEQ